MVTICLTTIILTNEKIKKRMFDQPIKQLGFTPKSERLVIFSKTYEGHYIIALKMFKQNPILGHGPKTFRKFCSEPENYVYDFACTTHPHNILMQLLAETGIIGSLFYLSIFFWITFNLFNIATATSYDLSSSLKPNVKFASTVSSPSSCSLYALILFVSPMSLPS